MKKIVSGIIVSVPVFAFAQGADATSILQKISDLLSVSIPIVITAALLFFIFGVVRYVIAGNPDDKDKAKGIITKGIIGLFVILSVWGLIAVIQRTFGIGNPQITSENLPSVQF